MNQIRILLRPKWIAAIVATIAFSLACLFVLAPWQFGKNTATQHRNTVITDPGDAVALDMLQSPAAALTESNEWRAVTVSGHYLADHDVTLRRRSAQGRPAVEVVTPFQTDGGAVLLINRGYLLRDTDQAAAAPAPPTGQLTLAGRLRGAEDTGRFSAPRTDRSEVVAYALDPERLGDAIGLPVAPFAIQLIADQPGGLNAIALPEPDAGPYLLYGVQWIVFGLLAPLALGYAVLSEARRRPPSRRVGGRSAAPAATVRLAPKECL